MSLGLFLSLAPLGFTVQTGRVKVQILLIYKPRGKRISCLQHLYTSPREDSSWVSQSVHAVCYNKNTIDWGAYKPRNFFLTPLEPGESRIRVAADLLSAQGQLPGS